jgi:hypothetical protein
LKRRKKQKQSLVEKKGTLETKLKLLTEEILKAKNQTIRQVFERQLEETAQELENMNWDTVGFFDATVPYRTALAKSKGLLKSPYFAWQNLKGIEQQRLFFFVFDEKLSYSKKAGYRTDNLLCAVRLFEDFVTSNTQDVDLGYHFWNRFATECDYLMMIMREYEADKLR